MASEHLIAQYAIYWVFPSSVARLACAVEANERFKLAYQASDKTVWILDSVTPVIWELVTGAGGAGAAGDPTDYSFDGDVIESGHQRIRYGAYELIGTLALEGTLVLI